jgi:condensin complex subunit 2
MQTRAADRGVNTLESNPANLKSKKIDMEFNVDPLFWKTSAAFDEGGARGLLLNHLNVYNGCEIIFDSSDAIRDEVPRQEDYLDPASEELSLDSLAGSCHFLAPIFNFRFLS